MTTPIVPDDSGDVNAPIEDRIVQAAKRFCTAAEDSHHYGALCLRHEMNLKLLRLHLSEYPKMVDYLDAAVRYREALSEKSAARYELAILLGW